MVTAFLKGLLFKCQRFKVGRLRVYCRRPVLGWAGVDITRAGFQEERFNGVRTVKNTNYITRFDVLWILKTSRIRFGAKIQIIRRVNTAAGRKTKKNLYI